MVNLEECMRVHTVVAEFGHKVLDVWSRESTEGFKAESGVFRHTSFA